MKKSIFVTFIVTLCVISAYPQSSLIDDFLKKHPSKEGITYVNISPKLMDGMFGKSATYTSNKRNELDPNSSRRTKFKFGPDSPTPEAYNSLTVTKTEGNSLEPSDIYADFKKKLISSDFEQYMEMNKNNDNVISYYQKSLKGTSNEIYILNKQQKHCSVIYLKGDSINIIEVNAYLSIIRNHLMLVEMQQNGFSTLYGGNIGPELAFSLPDMNNLNLDLSDLKNHFESSFDREVLQRSLEKFKLDNFQFDHDTFQRDIEDAINAARDQLEKIRN